MSLSDSFNYLCALFLILFGIFTMISAGNLYRKVFGLTFLQSGVILFYISLAYKYNSDIPILSHDAGHGAIDIAHYSNPLPHALMLTAIVVGVATLGVALVLIRSIHSTHHSVEEDEILKRMNQDMS